jgi:glycine betaine/choline ABC-type transport system substrate-binding protein
VYVEYTGTALTAILELPTVFDRAEAYRRVRDEYDERFHVVWGRPLGFNNTFAILVREADARALGIETISEAAPYTQDWTAGFGYEFVERADGYVGLAEMYGFRFRNAPRTMDLGLTYRALAAGQVDMIAGNSTDGLIEALDLFQLEDDRSYFPPYEAAPLIRSETLARHPEVGEALDALGGLISDDEMRKLNYMVDVEHQDAAAVVRRWLDAKLPLTTTG